MHKRAKRVLECAVAVVGMLLLGGADSCGETPPPQAPTNTYLQSTTTDDDRVVVVDLDADENGVPDTDGSGQVVQQPSKVKTLVGCGISTTVAAKMGNGECVNQVVFDCLKRMGWN